MQEAVIFPRPEEVNIIATRNGKLTNIPGTEFRAALAPYKTEFRLYYSTSNGLSVRTSGDTTATPISVFKMGSQKNPYGGEDPIWVAFATCFNVYQENVINTFEDITHDTYFQARLIDSNATPPGPDENIGFLVQLIGTKTTQFIDDTTSQGDSYDVVLPPSHSERVFVMQKNKVKPEFWTPHDG